MSFLHLRVHSEYSLVDGIVRIKELVAAARHQGMSAVALTDLSNMFGAVKFYREAVAAGIKPILGTDVWLENPTDLHKPFRLLLLCQSQEGYRNLCRLVTRAYTDGQHSGRPCIARSWLEDAATGLIALSGNHEGDIGQALLSDNTELTEQLVAGYQAWFPGRFYLELQRTGQPHQEDCNHALVSLSVRTGLPVVATNAVVFLKPEEYDAHEVRVCIQDGRVLTDGRRPRRHTTQQYFRSPQEMAELFQDIPEALENTVEIAKRCNVQLEFGRYYLPDYDVQGRTHAAPGIDAPIPEETGNGERPRTGHSGAAMAPVEMSIDDVLRLESRAGLEQRLQLLPETERPEQGGEYAKRLDMELDVIIQMGFSGYFLIVADFIHWAKSNGVPVGPGRGSGAGSLVAYALAITELDPIKYDLLFERFLNPERVSLPDFDIDFCMERRDDVIEYVTRRYGQDRVSQIITHGTMAARAVVRDVGRVMGHPYGYVDKLAKLIPFELGITLERALEVEPMLRERYENEEDVRELLDTARKLEGLARNAGKHAGGVVIAPSALTDFMPQYCEQGGKQMVTQFDKDDVEALGLVKFDFLGLRTLTIIDKAVKIINAEREKDGESPLVIEQIPIDDPATYSLLKSCRTTAMFQLESRGMKDLIQGLQPDNFEEIIALVALFRPGPLQSGMVEDFINRKHKRIPIKYLHPSLEHILKPTYGVILYQEQVMQIAQVLAGYSLGKADLLRRAMGKKKPEEMAQQREGFVSGAKERGVNEKLATHIFDAIEKFAGYGFNRSHSAAYALIAYQTAWLKAHHPAAFMAAVLSSDMDHTDKVVTMIAECRDMQLKILPPDINCCEFAFVPQDDAVAGDGTPGEGGAILYGLGAIKGLGQSAIEAIIQNRNEGGPFKDLFDLCKRIDLRKINRRVLESLIRAGALDGLGPHRAAIMASLSTALAEAGQHSRSQEAGQSDMFGTASAQTTLVYNDVPEWSEGQRLEGEKETLGLYLTGHPIARYAEELAKMTDSLIAELRPTQNRAIVVAGLVVAIRTMQTRRGDRMAFVTLDDRSGRLELAVFSDIYERHRELLTKDSLLVVRGQVSVDEYTGGFKMSAEEIYNVEQARNMFGARLVIDVEADAAGNGFIDGLIQILKPANQGRCTVCLHYRNESAEADIVLGEEWRISPTNAILERLEQFAGEQNVRLDYHPS